MKVSWMTSPNGQVGLHSQLGEYDGSPPVPALLMDQAPKSVNPEREAIAAYLAFGRWTSGDFIVPRKMGPNTAEAIERDLAHIPIRPQPLEYYPKALEIGTRTVHVQFSSESIKFGNFSVSVLPSSNYSGALRSLNSIAIASNAFALDASMSKSNESIRARLAVAVLFSGDLLADTLTVSCGASIPSDEKARLTKLLLSSRLGLAFV